MDRAARKRPRPHAASRPVIWGTFHGQRLRRSNHMHHPHDFVSPDAKTTLVLGGTRSLNSAAGELFFAAPDAPTRTLNISIRTIERVSSHIFINTRAARLVSPR
jgi:hypothetical protein